jgi:hemerythrin-like domain-containing protein
MPARSIRIAGEGYKDRSVLLPKEQHVADVIVLLKRDHREVKKILTRLSKTEEGDSERQDLVDQLVTALTRHMDLEEQLIYPMLDEHSAQEANTEHELVRESIAKMQEMASEPGFGALCVMVQAGLEHHIEEEENELLPQLKENTERQEWRELCRQVESRLEAREMPGSRTRDGVAGRSPRSKTATSRTSAPKSESSRSVSASRRG